MTESDLIPEPIREPLQGEPVPPGPKLRPTRRLRVWTLFLFLCCLFLGLTYGGIDLLLKALRPGTFIDNRIYDALEALLLLAFPAKLLWSLLAKKLSTGHWNKTSEERKQQVQQQQAQQCATQRPTTARPTVYDWGLYCLKWANYASHKPDTPPAKRIAAYSVLLLALLGYIATFLLPLVCVGAAFADDNTKVATCVFLILGLLVAIIPWLLTRSLLRYKRTHPSMRTQPEEMEQISARQKQWHVQENQKPLRSKIITTVITLGVLAFFWLRVTVFHAHHPHEDWTTPAMYTPFALYLIFAQFYKPSRPQAETQ